MTKAQAERLVKKWKSLLGLDGWNVSFEVDHPHKVEVDGELVQGWSRVNRNLRTVKIKVAEGIQDLEQTVVHELLHAYFDLQGMDRKDYEYVRSEQGVEMCACALVSLDRAAQPKKKRRK